MPHQKNKYNVFYTGNRTRQGQVHKFQKVPKVGRLCPGCILSDSSPRWRSSPYESFSATTRYVRTPRIRLSFARVHVKDAHENLIYSRKGRGNIGTTLFVNLTHLDCKRENGCAAPSFSIEPATHMLRSSLRGLHGLWVFHLDIKCDRKHPGFHRWAGKLGMKLDLPIGKDQDIFCRT